MSTTIHLSPIGNGTHVEVWRLAQPGDGLPHALGNRSHTLAAPTADGLTHVAAGGWQTCRGVDARVYVVHEAPALAAHLEQCEQAGLAGRPEPAISVQAQAELDALRTIHPALVA